MKRLTLTEDRRALLHTYEAAVAYGLARARVNAQLDEPREEVVSIEVNTDTSGRLLVTDLAPNTTVLVAATWSAISEGPEQIASATLALQDRPHGWRVGDPRRGRRQDESDDCDGDGCNDFEQEAAK